MANQEWMETLETSALQEDKVHQVQLDLWDLQDQREIGEAVDHLVTGEPLALGYG
jgi:hypothetical protein